MQTTTTGRLIEICFFFNSTLKRTGTCHSIGPVMLQLDTAGIVVGLIMFFFSVALLVNKITGMFPRVALV